MLPRPAGTASISYCFTITSVAPPRGAYTSHVACAPYRTSQQPAFASYAGGVRNRRTGTLIALGICAMTDLPFPAASAATPIASATAHRRPLRDWTLNLVVVAAALTVAFGLGELLVRLVAPQQLILKRPDVWKAVDSLGWVNWPNLHTTINTGERTVGVFTDQDGYRVARTGRVAGNKRILLLGDSFMEALQVEYEQSLAGLLETRLSQRLGEPVAVRNTGVGGWDPPQYFMQARHSLAREHFDLVLVSVYLGNDVVLRRVEEYAPRSPAPVHHLRLPRSLHAAEFIDALFYPFNDFMEQHSQLFMLLKTRLNEVLTRFGLTAEEFPEALLRQEADSPRWSVTAQILSDIRDLAQAHGAPTLFVLIPAPYQVDSAEFHRSLRGFRLDSTAVDLDQPDRLLTAAMRAHRVDVYDVLPDFRQAARTGSRLYGKVDRHPSPAGHELLERVLEPLVIARLGAAARHAASPAPAAR